MSYQGPPMLFYVLEARGCGSNIYALLTDSSRCKLCFNAFRSLGELEYLWNYILEPQKDVTLEKSTEEIVMSQVSLVCLWVIC